MLDGRREELRRRYLSLGTGELAAAATFAVVGVLVTGRLDDAQAPAAMIFALTPLLAVLAQGGVYWLVARTYVGRAPMPRAAAVSFAVCRVADVVLLVAGLVGLVVRWPGGVVAAALVALVWVFGVVEYLNYFVVRLAYPVGRWRAGVARRRTPQLVRDLREAAAAR